MILYLYILPYLENLSTYSYRHFITFLDNIDFLPSYTIALFNLYTNEEGRDTIKLTLQLILEIYQFCGYGKGRRGILGQEMLHPHAGNQIDERKLRKVPNRVVNW